MDVKSFNEVIAPRLCSARGFLGALNNAIEKSGPEAKNQMSIIGWNQEMEKFLFQALNALEKSEKSKITTIQPMQYIDVVNLIVLAANNGILCRKGDRVWVPESLDSERWYLLPIADAADKLMKDQEYQMVLVKELKKRGIKFALLSTALKKEGKGIDFL